MYTFRGVHTNREDFCLLFYNSKFINSKISKKNFQSPNYNLDTFSILRKNTAFTHLKWTNTHLSGSITQHQTYPHTFITYSSLRRPFSLVIYSSYSRYLLVNNWIISFNIFSRFRPCSQASQWVFCSVCVRVCS